MIKKFLESLAVSRLNWFRAASWIVVIALAGCGGGGGSEIPAASAAVPAGSSEPSFGPPNSTEQAFFSDSYEFIGANAFGVHGYVKNAATSTGDLGRTGYLSASGAYTPIAGIYVYQSGFLASDAALQGFDPWVLDVSAHGVVRNAAGSSYVLAFGADDWFTVQGIQEVDLAGKSFDAYLPPAALAGASGLFPLGAKAYTATWSAKQNMYLTASVASVFPRPASEHYLLDYYNSAAHAYCLNKSRALVVDSPTHATSYPVLVQSGDSCSVDTTTGAVSHTVTSRQVGTRWFFDFTNNQIQESEFTSDFFGLPGPSTQGFAIVLDAQSSGGVAEYSHGHAYSAGAQGAYLATSGVRLNKVAINAVLGASGLPAVP